MKPETIKKILIVLTFLITKQSSAATLPTSDFQIWGNVTAMGPVSGKVRYWLEGQGRFGDDASSLSQLLLRPGIGYVLNNTSSLWIGYAYINTRFPFSSQSSDENRIWQQFLWVKDQSWGRIFSRTRLEQRFIDSVSTTGWRFRQFVRMQRPFKSNNKAFIALTEEMFVQLNNTLKQASNRGFDQNRIFAGIGFLPNTNTLFEVGYQNQTIRRINTSNYSGNYLATNLIFNF